MVILTQEEAGRRLAQGVAALLQEVPVVVAVSAGGVRVAGGVAKVLEGPLDVIGVTRLEVPGRPRSIFGAVADGATILLEARVQELGLPPDYVASLVELAQRDVHRLAAAWRGGEAPVALAGRTVVLVDDGATEAVLVVGAATALREGGVRRLVFTAPSATTELCHALAGIADDRVLLYEQEALQATQVRDPSFAHTTDFDVHALVRRSRQSLAVVAP